MRKQPKFNDTSKKLEVFVEQLHKRKLSFPYGGTHYEFKSLEHLQNTINKLRREINKPLETVGHPKDAS